MRRKKPPLRPFEVITTFVLNGVSNRQLERYIVVSTSTFRALQALTLRENEEIVEAREMVNHKLVVMK